MESAKRDRSSNFSSQETEILVSLFEKYQGILENKRNDGPTCKQKESTWETIQKEFNDQSNGVLRTTKNLKLKYESLKRQVRKKCAAIQSELLEDGEGRTALFLDEVEEKIMAMITLNNDGVDGNHFKAELLKHIKETQDKRNHIKIEELYVPSPPSDIDRKDSSSPTSYFTDRPQRKQCNGERENLNSRRNPALAQLTEAKIELLQMQKNLLEEEIIEKRKEWEFKEKERAWREEEWRLKLEKMRKELND